MSKRIPQLLAEAERQKESSDPDESSISCADRSFAEAGQAREFFEQLSHQMLRVEGWNGKTALTSFEHFDDTGKPCYRPVVAGDFIRVRMAGSGKHDWVRVVAAVADSTEVIVTLKPTCDPTAVESGEKATSHFFTSEATNNLCLKLEATTVSSYVIGLSEKTNTDETGSLLEKARNVAVAKLGSYLGIQKGEWQKFCTDFLRLDEEG